MKYTRPPQEFIKVMHELYGDDYDFTDWEGSHEYRIFLAGNLHQAERFLQHIEKTIKYELTS